MTLSEMKQVLAEHQIRLTKSLGQNFLHDGNQLERVMAMAEVGPGDDVLEVGPGLGPLTERLLECARRVLAIEMDRRLVALLEQRWGAREPLELVHDDALAYLRRETRDWTGWKMVSNLPYSVASPILVELALCDRPPELMVVTLQHEVAKRLVAEPGSSDYGVLTLLLRLRYEAGRMFKIPATCFFPVPEVDSACLAMRRRAEEPLGVSGRELFVRVVKRGFSQRRKMMLKLLREEWPETVLEKLFAALGLSREVRAEKVGFDDFVALTQGLEAEMGLARRGLKLG